MDKNGDNLLRLADDCTLHLQREERALHEMVDILTTVRSALRTGDNRRLAEAADDQERHARQLHAILNRRSPLRESIAKALELPTEEATVLQLIEHTQPPHRSLLMQQRARVADLARSAEQLMQSNLLVVTHGMQLLQQILTCLTGNDMSAATYESTGQPVTPAHQAVFQTKC